MIYAQDDQIKKFPASVKKGKKNSPLMFCSLTQGCN